MEKEPIIINQKFEDVVRKFYQEMQKGRKKFAYCGEMEGDREQKKVLVQVYERYFIYPNICATATVFLEELEKNKTSITYLISSYEFGLLSIDFGVSSSMKREIEKRIDRVCST